MSSSIVSSMLFLLLLVFSLHMYEAFGAQTHEVRKLKETITMKRNLEVDYNRSSNMSTPPSITRRCGGLKFSKNMATTYGSLSPCHPCTSRSSYCYTERCTTTTRCQSINGSPQRCTSSTSCQRIRGN